MPKGSDSLRMLEIIKTISKNTLLYYYVEISFIHSICLIHVENYKNTKHAISCKVHFNLYINVCSTARIEQNHKSKQGPTMFEVQVLNK